MYDGRVTTGPSVVSLSEVLSALSYALDLTEGQRPGHSVRACLIGMRLAERAGLTSVDRSALYYALLLKDAGCSSNAARMAALFGTDDRDAKPRMKLVDWHQRGRLALRTLLTAGRGSSLAHRLRSFIGIARTTNVTRELIQVRCDRGAAIAAELGFPAATADAIRALDEHWCGLGYPEGRRETEIPLLARIANLAQTVELYHDRGGLPSALRVARERSGTWFDPDLVALLDEIARDDAWWRELGSAEAAAQVVGAEPRDELRLVDDAGLTAVARAFADIIDAKSPFTFDHSSRVADFARSVARVYGFAPAEELRLYRAGLLHDIGKLGVSNRILDKPERLTDAEFGSVRQHPLYTWEILSRVGAFRDIARLAALHHEKLDGTGYPWGIRGDDLDDGARILAVADIYEAVTADRPYRPGMTPSVALALLRKEAGSKLCARAVEALATCVTAGSVGPAGP
ncbi:MAG: HD domain-containing protein [Gemmatimonadaceae bacterium]